MKRETSVDKSVRARVPLTRYDLLLGIIPLALLGSIAAHRVLGLPVESTLIGGGMIALLALVDGLFLRPPNGFQGA